MSETNPPTRDDDGRSTSGSVVIGSVGLLYLIGGLVLLPHTLDVLTVRWDVVGPAALVLLGAFLLMGGLAAARK